MRKLSRQLKIYSTKSDSEVSSVSMSQDGKTLVSGGSGGTIKVWNLDFDWLMGRSCDWVRSYLQNNPKVSESDRDLCP